MSKKITIHKDNAPVYDIILENDFSQLINCINSIMLTGRKYCVVTDSNVHPLYAKQVMNVLSEAGTFVTEYVFEAGEINKNLDTVQKLYEHLILNHFERRDVLIALGGGVVGDLTGFTAATYLRGIDFIQIPTTLLAQVDSSIGGKTGVDFSSYKNMVGAFYMPKLVYMNLSTLNSLDERTFNEGFGEIIKHGYIQDSEYLDYISDNLLSIQNRDYSCLENIVYKSCIIKGKIVEEDPKEAGIRAILNYGHTLGHSVEKLTGFKYFHGECVILGMICSLNIGLQRNQITAKDYEAAMKLFNAFNFPTRISGINAMDVISTARNDKKMDSGTVKFILLNSIGDAYIDRTVTEEEMLQALDAIL